jgi:hypothetical protein
MSALRRFTVASRLVPGRVGACHRIEGSRRHSEVQAAEPKCRDRLWSRICACVCGDGAQQTGRKHECRCSNDCHRRSPHPSLHATDFRSGEGTWLAFVYSARFSGMTYPVIAFARATA